MILTLIALPIILAFTIIIHEVAHAWMADRLGDPTARLMGRLTLNPIPHIDMYGTVIVPLLLVLMRAPFIFGWAKPVPIDPYNLKNPKKDSALISLAGPGINLIVATILAIILRFGLPSVVAEIIITAITFNVAIAIFNLLPVSPLDGEKILVGILPEKEGRTYEYFMSKFGYLILFLMIFPLFGGASLVSQFLYPIISIVLNLLLPGFSSF